MPPTVIVCICPVSFSDTYAKIICNDLIIPHRRIILVIVNISFTITKYRNPQSYPSPITKDRHHGSFGAWRKKKQQIQKWWREQTRLQGEILKGLCNHEWTSLSSNSIPPSPPKTPTPGTPLPSVLRGKILTHKPLKWNATQRNATQHPIR